jgi:hypothetical protein
MPKPYQTLSSCRCRRHQGRIAENSAVMSKAERWAGGFDPDGGHARRVGSADAVKVLLLEVVIGSGCGRPVANVIKLIFPSLPTVSSGKPPSIIRLI